MLRVIAATLLLAAGCTAAAPRGYYRPAGAPPQDTLTPWIEQGPDMLIEARCQGAYENEVDGERIGTVHVQLDAARTRAGDLSLPRDSLLLLVQPGDGGTPVQLRVSEVWSGRARVPGDLVVPGWSRRPFDIFFDEPTLLDTGAPLTLRLEWELQAAQGHPGSCEWALIPDDDPFAPSRLLPADETFGFRNGYYLPGVELGERRVRLSGEERLHYLYHEQEGWLW